MKRKRASDLEFKKRVNTIKDMILSDYDSPEIVQFCMDKYQVSSVQGYNYINAAWKEIYETEIFPKDKDKILWRLKSLQLLKKRTMNIQDYKTALQIDKEINELLGLHNQNIRINSKSEVTGDMTHKILQFDIDEEQIDKIIADVKND